MKSIQTYILASFCALAFMACEKDDALKNSASPNSVNRTLPSNGIGGSMAQFTIVDEYLYTVDYKSLKIFDISSPETPVFIQSVDLGIGIESVFPQDNLLFIGTQSGVRIVEITEPSSPQLVSEFDHVTSCDPVVAEGNLAVATLRGGTACGGNLNSLDLIDLSNITNPELISSTELSNPYGLGFADNNTNLVYVCDGFNGLSVYDVSNVQDVQEVMHMDGIEAIDVISQEDHLIVLTRSSVIQYDATNPLNLIEKSVISIQ